MSIRHLGCGGFLLGAALLWASVLVQAQQFTISSNFDSDTPGLPPGTGGTDQPTGIIDGGVLVAADANGISTQPLVVDDGVCDHAYFGGVYYDLPVVVDAGSLRIEFTVAVNQLTDGTIFDTAVSYYGATIARLDIEDDGTILDHFDTPVASYAPNTPLRVRAELDLATKSWACTVDDELDGFADDPIASGLPFVNPGISQIGLVAPVLFGNYSTCTGSRIIAYDDVYIISFPPIFVDGFESGDTLAWTRALP